FQGQQPQKQAFGVDGDVAYGLPANGSAAVRAPDAVARDRRIEYYQHPLTIVRALLDPNAKVTHVHTAGNERVADVTPATGVGVTLAIDDTTHLPTRVVAMTDNTNLGDVAVETTFADYQDVSGVKLPRTLTTTIDKYRASQLRVTNQVVDADLGDVAAPAN